MKYGIHFSYWSDRWAVDYRPYLEKAATLGFDLLEISCAGLRSLYTSKEELYALRQCAENSGIGMSAGYGPGAAENLCSADPEVTARALRFYAQMLPKLQYIGINVLAGPLYAGSNMEEGKTPDRSAEYERAVRNFQKAAKIAEDNGVTLALEVVNRYESWLLNSCAQALAFVGDVGSRNVQVMLDTFHMNIEEDSLCGALRKADSQLCHLHISERDRRVPGQGDMPWADIGQVLREISYDGAVVMEAFPRAGGEVGQKVRLWRDIIDNPTDEQLDRDAAQALTFLRSIWGQMR